MSGQDWFLFILTFITGVMAGMYVYILSFKPTYIPDDLNSNEDVAAEFSVVGKVYGGQVSNGYISPSFRITADGSYAYVPGGEGSDALEPVSGKLPNGLFRDVVSATDKNTLINSSEPINKESCRSYSDGLDYQYRIVLDNNQYEVDTCRTTLSYDAELALVLDAVWNYLANPDSSYGGQGGQSQSVGGTPADRATEFIRKHLSPYTE